MEIQEIHSKTYWNDLLKNCIHQDLQQTWDYGESLHTCYQWDIFRHQLDHDGQPLAIFQTLTKEFPSIGKIARIQNGPLFLSSNLKYTYKSILEYLIQYWTQSQNSTLYFTPCLYPNQLELNWWSGLNIELSQEITWQSIRIDLTKPEDELWKRLRRTGWREPIQKAQTAGYEFKWSNADEDFEFLISKYKHKQNHLGFYWPSVELVQTLRLQDKNSISIIKVQDQQTPIAAMAFYTFFSTSFCLISWSNPEYRTLFADQFMFWQSVLHFKELNYQWLDLGGIDEINLPGITQFKRGMHGEEYQWAGSAIAKSMHVSENNLTPFTHFFHFDHIESSSENQLLPSQIYTKAEQQVRHFLQHNLGIEIEIESTQSLINGGLIDSLSIISLVQSIQKEFDIDIHTAELTLENFDTIEKISAFIKMKKTL